MNKINEASALPLWRGCLKEMQEDGIDYGKVYEIDWFVDRLRSKPESIQFRMAIQRIRRKLEEEGFVLTERGAADGTMRIAYANENADNMIGKNRAAFKLMARSVVLGQATKASALNEDEKRRHDSVLYASAARFALVSRADEVDRLCEK